MAIHGCQLTAPGMNYNPEMEGTPERNDFCLV